MMDESARWYSKLFPFPILGWRNALFSKLYFLFFQHRRLWIGMEATGTTGSLSTHFFLKRSSFSMSSIRSRRTAGAGGQRIRKRKNDIIDSVLIADLIRYGSSWKPGLQMRIYSPCVTYRFRTYLVESISDLKRKVVCVLDQVFPEYQSIFSDIFGKTSKEILLQFSSPIDFERFHRKPLQNCWQNSAVSRSALQKQSS